MKKNHWMLIVTRETTLLERYLRNTGYIQGVGKISKLKISTILSIANDGVNSQYFDQFEIDKCKRVVVLDEKHKLQQKLFTRFGKVLVDLINFCKAAPKKNQSSNHELLKNLNSFITLYGYGRGVVLYCYFAADVFSNQLRLALISAGVTDIENAFRVLTTPSDGDKRSKNIFDRYLKPHTAFKSKQEKIIRSLVAKKAIADTSYLVRQFTYYHELAERVTSRYFTEFERMLKVIAHKTGVSENDLKFYSPNEIRALLLKDTRISDQQIRSRKKKFVLVVKRGKIKFFEGKIAARIEKRELPSEKSLNIKTFSGQVAHPGKTVKGVVRIVIKQDDVSKMKRGDILVSPMTTPRLILAVRLAGAIVTDEGGVTSHAAIVAREFGIPCIIGTKISTKVLRDGDRVSVNTQQGIVTKLK